MSITIKGQIRQSGRTTTREFEATPPAVFTNTLAFTLDNPDGDPGDQFGQYIALDGNYMITGSFRDNTVAQEAGKVYIHDVTTGNLLHTLNNPTPESIDRFGWRVDISGNRAIVSALRDNTGAADAGSAYIYDVTTGNLLHTLNNPTPQADDEFGLDVGISGNLAIVSSSDDDTNGTDIGVVYVYNVTTGLLVNTIVNPTLTSGDQFGWSSDIDGNNIIVGAFHDSTGATEAGSAYIFDATTGNLLHTLNNPSPETDDSFGQFVAISGNRAIVAAFGDNTGAANTGSAYIYDVTTGNLLHTINNPTPQADDQFSVKVAIGGNLAVIGAQRNDNGLTIDVGTAYVYDVTTGNLLHTIENPTPDESDRFGTGVAVSGANVAIGASLNDAVGGSSGTVYIYN